LKLATLNVIKIFILCIILLLPIGSDSNMETTIKVGEVTNDIRMGKFAGNRNLALGVENILEELLLDLDYDLSDDASTQVNVRLVFFDVKNIGKSVGVYHNQMSVTEIIAIGELVSNGKVIKRTTQKGQSKEISNSTLVVADDGSFNQQTASIALKKVLDLIVKDLLG